jgi:plastocyanin
MTDWDLMTPGIGLTSIGIVGVGVSLSGIAKTFIEGMHAVALLTMFIGMIFLASGLFKDGFPTSGRAKSATFITLGFLVTFGFAAAVTVSTQIPSIYAYIGLMLLISIPAAVLAVASYRGVQYLKPLAVIFIGAAIVGGTTFYAFGVVAPKPAPESSGNATTTPQAGTNNNQSGLAAQQPVARPANTISAKILPGASAQGNPDFDPDPVSVKKGDGVEWTNGDNVPHTVTSKQQGAFDSGIINAGAKWLLNTAKLEPAKYEYYCTIHPFMGATLVVTNAAAPPANSSGNATTTPQAGTNNNQSGAGANETAGNTTRAGAATSNASSAAASITKASIVIGASVPTKGEFYSPDNVETSVGSMVTWKNDDDDASHTMTSGTVQNNKPTTDGRFTLGIINTGQSFLFVFDKAGEYPYYCSIHPMDDRQGHCKLDA